MTEAQRVQAARFDAEDRPVEAAAAYELAIREHNADLDLYLSLAGIYLVCQDFGYLSAKKLPDAYVTQSWQRYNELLDEAERRFGPSDRIDFWRHYGRWRVLLDAAETPRLREIYLRGSVPEACLVAGEADSEDVLVKVRALFDSLGNQDSIIARDMRSIARSRLQMAGLLPHSGRKD